MAKGGSFEREISEELSLWFTQGERDDIFGRSDGSGGRFTRRKNKGTESQAGDITFTDPEGWPLIQLWNIEAKTGYGGKKRVKDEKGVVIARVQKQWDVLECIDSKKSVPFIIEAWGQCLRDAILTNRKPILIFRRNLRSKCIVMEMRYFNILCDYFGKPSSVSINLCMSPDELKIIPLKDFFEWIPDIRPALLCESKKEEPKNAKN
jgi:hypothetical protein